nr:acylphosphatase [Ahniella affigens]
MRARAFLVHGRVQGVSFRAATRLQALRLGLRGYARNRPDGTVEVLAIGPETGLAQLESWLWRGPVLARVDHVTMLEEPLSDGAEVAAINGFQIG